MKAKKLTKVEQVKALLKDNPNIQTKDVAKALNIAYAYACTLVWKAKNGKKSKRLTPVNKKDRELKEYNTTYTKQYVNGLENRVTEMFKKIQELTNQNTALKIDLLDHQAVITYLEGKLFK